ncbi:MAG: hypothetical protein EBY29_05570, partial [Planctomycetes bacterium]|nr:hypothetical protein [Planctomycetota bacterium]
MFASEPTTTHPSPVTFSAPKIGPVTALAISKDCPPGAREFAVKLFASVGRVELLHESHLDAATAISSSGIAYLCLFIEALERAAIQLGLPKDVAKNLS